MLKLNELCGFSRDPVPFALFICPPLIFQLAAGCTSQPNMTEIGCYSRLLDLLQHVAVADLAVLCCNACYYLALSSVDHDLEAEGGLLREEEALV